MAYYKIHQIEAAFMLGHPPGAPKDNRGVFSLTLLRGEGHCILVDAGIDPSSDRAQEFHQNPDKGGCFSAKQLLAPLGVTPEEVDTIILTHMHWDHIGGVGSYPNAKIYVQREEFWGWADMLAKDITRPLASKTTLHQDLEYLFARYLQGRVVLLDGAVDNLFDGISIQVSTLGHTFAMNLVLVHNEINGKDKTYAIVGDLCTSPENLLGTQNGGMFVPHTGFAIGSVVNILHDYEKLMDWVDGDVGAVVMTHDSTWQKTAQATKHQLGFHIRTICP